MDTRDWPSVCTGVPELRTYLERRPMARMVVEFAGSGAIVVLLPTQLAVEEFARVVCERGR